jgi:hypothetical protein
MIALAASFVLGALVMSVVALVASLVGMRQKGH